MRGLKITAVMAAVAAGLLAGLGSYTFVYARGYSYLQNDPAACANCHVMQEQLDGWTKSSHRSVAACNDCHTPHDLVGKYATKMRNGFWHSFYFTSGSFHEPIHILPRDRQIAEDNCRRCHDEVVQAMGTPAHAGGDQLSCIRCHGSVGHQELSSISLPFSE